MKTNDRKIVPSSNRKASLALLAIAAVAAASGLVFPQQLSMTATYPIPVGVYNQIVTTGNSGSAPADTVLNRGAGHTLLVPPTNSSGRVGIGTSAPASKLHVAGGIQLGDDSSDCIAEKDGTLRWHASAFEVCSSQSWKKVARGPISCTRTSIEPGEACPQPTSFMVGATGEPGDCFLCQ